MNTDFVCKASDHVVGCGCTVREALVRLNALPGGRMTLFVTDGEGHLCGSLTDGDVRRALIAGCGLEDRVSVVMNGCPHALRRGCDVYVAVAAAREKGLRLLPRLDASGRPENILDLSRLKSLLPVDAVLMAGGRGERLRPLTLNTPKPLLRVGDKCIIDYNVDELRANGVENIHVTVNYLKEQLEEHFRKRGDGVRCVSEPKRLGTMGSLSLVEDLRHDTVLLMNSDLLTDISFEALYRRHTDTGADLTMSVVPYNVSVPFGIINTEGDRVTGLQEKPVYNYYANAGVYMMKAEVLPLIEKGKYLDAPDFVERLIAKGRKVSYFPIEGTWIDIGSPDDYRRACDIMSTRRAL